MTQRQQTAVALFVDRNQPSGWIVRDGAGDFWVVTPGERAWEGRQPYTVTEDSQLEAVPGHYKYVLGIAG